MTALGSHAASSPVNPHALPPADVCVLTVAYNSGEHLGSMLASIEPAADGLTTRVVVVDNDSSDDSVEIAARNGAVVINSGGNLGYAGGINVGRGASLGCRSILIVNADLELLPGSIRALHREVEETSAVAIPKIIDPSGMRRWTLQREPTILRQTGEALFGDRWPGRPAWLAITIRQEASYARPLDVDWASGAALLVPAVVDRDAGPWEESFFLYSEEVEFARRVRSAGYRLRYVPDAVAVHVEGGSGRSDELFALTTVNKIRYFSRWHARPATLVFGGAVLLELLLRMRQRSRRRAVPHVLLALRIVVLGRSWPSGGSMVGLPEAQ